MSEATLVDRLDSLINVLQANSIPLESRWVDVDGIGAILGFSRNYVQNKITVRPDFPRPMRLGDKGHPRWSAQEIQAWAKLQQDAPAH
jgi:predicted DNA-binding transcriptional regulator AlpA